MAYSETRSIIVTTPAPEAKTLTTSGAGSPVSLDVKVPAGITACSAATIAGVSANLTIAYDAANHLVRLWATAGTFAVAKDDAVVLTLTQQKQYGLEAAYGIEHTVTHP